MIRTSIEIDNLVEIENRRVDISSDIHFAKTIAFLVSDYATKNNIPIEEVKKEIDRNISIIEKFK